jgi:cysteine desulfurase/selenocysteine lyase
MSNQSVESVDLNIERVRQDFPILHQMLPKGLPLVYLDNAATAQKPRAVIEREREVYETFYANAYRGVYRFGAQVDEEVESTRAKVQALIHASSVDEIVFTSGSTMSINMVAAGWGRRFLGPGDEVLLNQMEHHANLVPWQYVAEARGAKCRYLPLTSDGRLDLSRLDEHLTANTRMVAVTAMSNVLGTINPIRELVSRARRVGAKVLVDGAQSVPHQEIDVVAADIDFLAFSGHKIYGPSGIGVLYGKQDLLEAMDPFLMGGHMIDRVDLDRSTWAAPPAKFEAGTIPIAQAIALGEAIDYVGRLGYSAIETHEKRLLAYAFERLTQIPGLRIYGPGPEHRGAIVSFSVEGAHPEDLAQLLDRRGVFVRHGHHCTMPLHTLLGVPATVRASFALYNTLAEVDALAEAIEFARGKLRLG